MTDSYPDTPGWRDPDTSRKAALEIADNAATYRQQVFELLCDHSYTVHEAAEILNIPIPSIQPRFSELLASNRIYDTGQRRTNKTSGKTAKVWRALASPAPGGGDPVTKPARE